MKRMLVSVCSVLLSVCMTVLSVCAAVDANGLADPYWAMQSAYEKAVKNGSAKEIIAAGNEIIDYYEALNTKTACDRTLAVVGTVAKQCEETGDFAGAADAYGTMKQAYVWLSENVDAAAYAQALRYADALLAQYADIEPVVYTLAKEAADVPDYGAVEEPTLGTFTGTSGAYYGDRGDGFLLYVTFFNENISDFAYRLPETDEPYYLEVAWNVPHETKEDLDKINSGSWDSYIIKNLQYLNTLADAHIYLRFGAEVNTWSSVSTYKDNLTAFQTAYINAFRRIAGLTRTYAPEVAIVYSPNDISNLYVTVSDFYPGDAYVDWVGVSVYQNLSKDSVNTYGSKNDAYYIRGVYDNPLLRVREVVETFGDRKPILISECGFAYADKTGLQEEAYAKEKLTYFYSYINMVYPQVKGIFYFNTNYQKDANAKQYKLFEEDGSGVTATTLDDTYLSVLRTNGALCAFHDGTPEGYTRLETLKEVRDSVTVSTYAYYPGRNDMVVTYTFDKKTTQVKTVPYTLTLDKTALTHGEHTLTVKTVCGSYKTIQNYTVYVRGDGTVVASKNAAVMSDVKQTAWDYPYLLYCIREGFFEGLYKDTKIEPEKAVTRAEFVTLLGRAAGIDESRYTAAGFTDVPKNAYYAPYVAWAKENGITAGTNAAGTLFSPDAVLTRDQACAFIMRYYENVLGRTADSAKRKPFADEKKFPSYFVDNIYAARNAGLINGNTENAFMPDTKLCRNTISVILKNLHETYIIK